jgi:hypothetical protein
MSQQKLPKLTNSPPPLVIVTFLGNNSDKITLFKDLNLKADMGDHFDENEKNPPGSATVAKYSKEILKLIYLNYLTAPRSARGVKRTKRT